MSECEIQADSAWSEQFYCGLHCVWFRHGGEPEICPCGEEYQRGRREAFEEMETT